MTQHKTYKTAGAFRRALEERLKKTSQTEPAELLVMTHRFESLLPANLAKRIAFIVQSFAE